MTHLYNRKEAAQALKVSVETLDRYRFAGKLPYHRIGDRILFTESDIAEFLNICSIKPNLLPATGETDSIAKAIETTSNL